MKDTPATLTRNIPASTAMTRLVIELGYSGDYPGAPRIQLNGRWLTHDEQDFLISLFCVDGKTISGKEFFDLCGARKIPGSEEHEFFIGRLELSVTPSILNDA